MARREKRVIRKSLDMEMLFCPTTKKGGRVHSNCKYTQFPKAFFAVLHLFDLDAHLLHITQLLRHKSSLHYT
jgi:hypothetical protein